jgi:5'-nucleotidase
VTWRNVQPSTLLTVRGIPVGVIGVTTIETAAVTIGVNVTGLTFAPLAAAIAREATALRARGATVIVVLAHAGGRCTRLDDPHDSSSCDQMAEIVNVLHDLPSGLVDVIAAGHTHQAMAQEVGGTAVVEAYSTGRSFSRVDVEVKRSSGAIVSKHIFPPQDVVAGRYEGQQVTPDGAASAAILPAVRQAVTLKNQPLGVHLQSAFARGDQQDETALADMVTDGMLASVPSADVAIGNGGSLRTDLQPGPLTYGQMYELYPFDNRLVTLTLTGDQLTHIVAYSLTRRVQPTELLPIAGFSVDAWCEGGSLRVALRRASGKPVRPTDRLTVVTSDFVAGGGDGVLGPAGALGQIGTVPGAPLLRESVVAWLKGRGGRLDANDFMSSERRRWHFPSPRPVMCS